MNLSQLIQSLRSHLKFILFPPCKIVEISKLTVQAFQEVKPLKLPLPSAATMPMTCRQSTKKSSCRTPLRQLLHLLHNCQATTKCWRQSQSHLWTSQAICLDKSRPPECCCEISLKIRLRFILVDRNFIVVQIKNDAFIYNTCSARQRWLDRYQNITIYK